MFDISFAELMMVAIVSLLVIGPEKLPKVARTLGAYTGRLQRYVSQVKEEVSREVRFEELQTLQQEIQAGTDKVKSNIRASEQSVKDTLSSIEEGVKPKRKSAVKKAQSTKAKATTKKPTAKKSPVKKAVFKKSTVRKTAAKKPSVKPATNKASS